MNEFCYQSTDCITEYCLNNICLTKEEGAKCSSSVECGIEMKCY